MRSTYKSSNIGVLSWGFYSGISVFLIYWYMVLLVLDRSVYVIISWCILFGGGGGIGREYSTQ